MSDYKEFESKMKKSSGKKFFEVDIHGIQEEIKEIIDSLHLVD